MVKRINKPKTGTYRRVFRNSDDVFQFEKDLHKKERLSILPKNTKFVKTTVPKGKYVLSAYYCHPKSKKIIRIDPNDKEAVQHFTQEGYVPALEYLKQHFLDSAKAMGQDPNLFFHQEIEPVIFSNKGKTAPSVPYLRVFVESSLGDNKTLHVINNKTRIKQEVANKMI